MSRGTRQLAGSAILTLAQVGLLACATGGVPPSADGGRVGAGARANADGAVGGRAVPSRDTVYVIDTVPANRDDPIFAEELLVPATIDPILEQRIRAVTDAPRFRQIQWGVLARDMHTGRVIYERNAHQKFVPASNMKILTAAAALTELGPDFRFETALWSDAELDSRGVLSGPLILDGRGDPTLSGRFHESGRAALAVLARRLHAAGVRRVSGPLVIDASRWDSTSVRGTWMVEDVGWPWGASGGAFVVDEGEIEVVVLGGNRPGDPASVIWPADLSPARFSADVVTTAADTVDLRPGYRPERRQIVLGGRIRPALRRQESLAARDPVGIAGELLLAALRTEGIRVDGGLELRWEPGQPIGNGCVTGAVDACGARLLAHLESPPLSTVVGAFLAPSQNFISEQVVRALGLERGRRGSWEEGLGVMERALTREFAVLTGDIDLRDGSGLSAYSLVTPRAMVDVLFKIRIGAVGEDFRDALASPGEGTLAGRLGDLRGRLWAKTGSLTHVSSLSGYLVRDNGREMVFSILTGNAGLESREVRRAVDELVRELTRW